MISCFVRMKYALKYFAKSSCQLVQFKVRNLSNFSSHNCIFTFLSFMTLPFSFSYWDYLNLYVLNLKCNVYRISHLCLVRLRHDFIWKMHEAFGNSPRSHLKTALARPPLWKKRRDRVREPSRPLPRRHRARAERADAPHPFRAEDRRGRQDWGRQVDALSDTLQNHRGVRRQDLHRRSGHLDSGAFWPPWQNHNYPSNASAL